VSNALSPRAQRILADGWKHAGAARDACRAGSWGDFLRERAGRLGWTAFEHKKCLELATSLYAGPHEQRTTLIPVWIGNNEGEEPDDTWFKGHVELVGDDPTPRHVGIGNPFEDAEPSVEEVVHCRSRAWTVGHVVSTRDYAEGIELAYRGKRHGVLQAEVVEVLEATAAPSTPLPRPTILVPPWCTWLEPRVAELEPELVDRIRGRSMTVDDEGNVHEGIPSLGP
jgi:hypothetical protein